MAKLKLLFFVVAAAFYVGQHNKPNKFDQPIISTLAYKIHTKQFLKLISTCHLKR